MARGGSKQHTSIPQGRTKIQMRWIYLGYDFNISRTFSTAILLAAEDYITTGTGTTNGEFLADIKLAFYIKLINLRWKNIWKATDLVLGQVGTPAYSIFTEQIWGYRPIDWRVTDIRRTPSCDSGITVQCKYGKDGRSGYYVRAGNGTSARPENDNFRWYNADVWALFINRKLTFDVYVDYEKLNDIPSWHHSRSMIKGFASYSTPAFTFGIEGYLNNLKNEDFATRITVGTDTWSGTAKGISLFANGVFIPKRLKWFVRFDRFNPDNRIDNAV